MANGKVSQQNCLSHTVKRVNFKGINLRGRDFGKHFVVKNSRTAGRWNFSRKGAGPFGKTPTKNNNAKLFFTSL